MRKPLTPEQRKRLNEAKLRWYHRNHEQEIKKQQAWKNANRQHLRDYDRARYRADPSFRDRKLAASARRAKQKSELRKAARVLLPKQVKDPIKRNPAKEAERQRRWRKANPEKAAATQARFRKAHPDRVKAEIRAWRDANRDRVRTTEAAWKAANLELWKALKLTAHHRRRTLKMNCVGTHTNEEWLERLRHHNHCCAYCGSPQNEGLKLTRDHYISLKRGGTNYADNIVPACSTCNSKKKDRDPLEFIASIRNAVGHSDRRPISDKGTARPSIARA